MGYLKGIAVLTCASSATVAFAQPHNDKAPAIARPSTPQAPERKVWGDFS
jgi:hypothetical protein